MLRFLFFISCTLWLWSYTMPVFAYVTVLAPSQPVIDAPSETAQLQKNSLQNSGKTKEQKKQAKKEQAEELPEKSLPADPEGTEEKAQDISAAPAEPQIDEEVDLLITQMRPADHTCINMDMPQMFAVLRFDANSPVQNGALLAERRDLLGDIEEIQYVDKKAWGANVALAKPGLYHFVIETRPRWIEAQERFEQHFVKVSVPVHGESRGWHEFCNQRLEIIPRIRPFGLQAPTLFNGTALWQGSPLAHAPVRMYRINTDQHPKEETIWESSLEALTNKDGEFSFVLNKPGWWCCEVKKEGDPLKGPDGEPKPLQFSGIFWLYVDTIPVVERKR